MSHRRIIVAETRSPLDRAGVRPRFWPRADVAPPGPGRALRLPVGVLRWSAPTPTLTVIVKVTLTFDRACETVDDATWAELAPEQPPLSGTRLLAPGSQDLAHPTDFVPFKRHADVLLTGHAYAPLRPSAAGLGAALTQIDAGFSVDRLSRVFALTAPGAHARLPLGSELRRSGHGHEGVEIVDPVGPIASPDVVAPQRWHDKNFDFTRYNAASKLQRVPSVEPDAIIRLIHLSPRAEELKILLPSLAPRVLMSPSYGDSNVEIEMDCDTLVIDTDRETMTLLFRGDHEIESVDTTMVGRLVVSLESTHRERSIGDILRELPHGMFFYAAEPEDMIPDAPPIPDVSAELTMARYETWGHERAPDPTLSLERYAQVSAELAEKRETRAKVLQRHDLDEDRWTLEERAWAEILAEKGAENDGAFADELSRHLVAARARVRALEA
jgi:hypothetical protein